MMDSGYRDFVAYAVRLQDLDGRQWYALGDGGNPALFVRHGGALREGGRMGYKPKKCADCPVVFMSQTNKVRCVACQKKRLFEQVRGYRVKRKKLQLLPRKCKREGCDVVFVPTRKGQAYCCQKCRSKGRTKNTPLLTCKCKRESCSVVFQPLCAAQVYCSKKCRTAEAHRLGYARHGDKERQEKRLKYAAIRAVNYDPRTCERPECGLVFRPTSMKNKYCSMKCRRKHGQAQWSNANRDKLREQKCKDMRKRRARRALEKVQLELNVLRSILEEKTHE